MSVLKIELLGSAVLRRRAGEIADIDEDLRRLVRDMFETMYAAEGIGLAGPQVGVDRRLIVVDVGDETSAPMALINPQVVEASDERDRAEEGCLSIPGVAGVVERHSRVVVEGLSETGEPVRVEADGLLGRCLQHEIDHLDGVLFVDRLSPLKRNMVLKKYRTLAAEEGNGREGEGARAGARARG